MDGEAGLENAVLHPAHEQLFGGGGTGKAADVRALVGLAGQTHAGDDGDIVLQALPAGVVVAAPCLGVALDTGAAAAADHVGTCLGVVLHHGIGTHLAHQGAHKGASAGRWCRPCRQNRRCNPCPSDCRTRSCRSRRNRCPTAMMDSVRYFFHAARPSGLVKSQNAPSPPHHLPTP